MPRFLHRSSEAAAPAVKIEHLASYVHNTEHLASNVHKIEHHVSNVPNFYHNYNCNSCFIMCTITINYMHEHKHQKTTSKLELFSTNFHRSQHEKFLINKFFDNLKYHTDFKTIKSWSWWDLGLSPSRSLFLSSSEEAAPATVTKPNYKYQVGFSHLFLNHKLPSLTGVNR